MKVSVGCDEWSGICICTKQLLGALADSSYLSDLNSIGGLVPLLGYLKNAHANIRAKAADVVTTVVQNNPKSQQLVMEANGLEPLLSNFTSDEDITARTKALGAISCEYFSPSCWIFIYVKATLRNASAVSVLFGTPLHFFPCDLWWMDLRNFLIMVWVCFSFNHAQQARNCCISSCKWLWCSERCFEFRECEIPKVTCVNDSIDSIYQLWCHFDFHHFSVTVFLFWVRIFSIPRLLFGPFFPILLNLD